ncbi:hypothetical protein OAO18_07975 [Francisellaceae bacterium]|nr:hypothetical protein [Francisellaceae bacterium]
MRRLLYVCIALLYITGLYAQNSIISLDGKLTHSTLLSVLSYFQDELDKNSTITSTQDQSDLIDLGKEMLFQKHDMYTSKFYYNQDTHELTYNIRPPSLPNTKSISSIIFGNVGNTLWEQLDLSSKSEDKLELEGHIEKIFSQYPIVYADINIELNNFNLKSLNNIVKKNILINITHDQSAELCVVSNYKEKNSNLSPVSNVETEEPANFKIKIHVI